MWHVDEGALHAYLDGALDEYPAAEARKVREHLETCAQCGARLAEERRVRDEAHEILGFAAPAVEVPSLEELRSYVRAQAPQRSRVSVRLYRLGWAASVVLALGTGWLLRGGVPPTVTSTSRLETESLGSAESAQSDDAAARAPSAEALEEQPAPATSANRAAGAVAPPGEPRRELAGRVAEPVDEVEAAGGTASNGLVLADAVDADAAAKAADDFRSSPDTREIEARRVAAEPAAVSPAPTTAAEPEQATAGNRARQDLTARDAAAAPQRAAEQRRPSTTSQAPAVAPLGAGAAAVGRGAGADGTVDAPSEVDDVSLLVPGLEVLDVLGVGPDATLAGMRALQRLPSGDTLETIHLREGIDPASLPALPSGWTEIVRARGPGWLVMRARLPEASLLELLQRLEDGR